MAERFADFENQEIQELKENSENQNTTKSTFTWLISRPARLKTRTLRPICSPMKQNNSTKVKLTSQAVVQTNNSMICK